MTHKCCALDQGLWLKCY